MNIQEKEILLVDDIPANLELLSGLLENQGYQVNTAASGPEALAAVEEKLPSLILLDIFMPGMDGFEVCHLLKQNKKTRDIPIIFISALDDTENKIAGFAAGGVDYITKPFQSKEVFARLKTHLSIQDMQKQLLRGKKEWEATIDAVSELIILTDPDGKIIRRNQAAIDRFQDTCGEILGAQIEDVCGATGEIDLQAARDRPSHAVLKGEIQFSKLDEWYEVASFPVFLEDELIGFVYSYKDITEHKRRQAAERAAREFAEALHDIGAALNSSLHIDDVLDEILEQIKRVIPHDTASILLVEGDHARLIRTSGYERYGEHLIERTADRTFEINKMSHLREMAKTGQPCLIPDTANSPDWYVLDSEIQIRSWVGAPFISKNRMAAFIGLDNAEPNFFRPEHADRLSIFAAQASLAMENARLFDEVNEMATVDSLTGLFNRGHFFTLAEREFERSHRHHRPLSLILLDLDRLKDINTRHGHIVGGQALQAVGKFLREHLLEVHIPGLYGGDEFVILLPETEMGDACIIAESIREIIASTPIDTYKGLVSITISLGVASLEDDPDFTLETLVDQADQALYQAKDGGRNRVCKYTSAP